ncbi:MAG: Type 1 glutamine amidotransferase-like domain-containing protein [Solobacterium sp.]|nr:Type 1 glutamine amidotransferase-like domain-containing protein [Solobacterium sp.]
MTKKIVAIAGGENGRPLPEGGRAPYDTESIDREIVRLTDKAHPHFLMIAHSQPTEDRQQFYFEVMRDIYERYGCECRDLKSTELEDLAVVQEKIGWADIIYEGGGDTLSMIALWKRTGFDKVLRQAWEDGKVLCGLSAGGNCWFESCSSDSLKIIHNDPSQPFIEVDCLGFLKGYFIPHSDVEATRIPDAKENLRDNGRIGFALSNCAALEFVDDTYKVLKSADTAFARKLYWKDGICCEEELNTAGSLEELYSR